MFSGCSWISLASDAYPPGEPPHADLADQLEAERTERQRLADADTAELQQAASVRLATRQAVREALDDILDESSEGELDKGR